MEWVDITSYGRGERGKVMPRSWELKGIVLRVVVTRQHRLPGWWLRCVDASIPVTDLNTDDVEVAKVRAIRRVRERLDEMMADVVRFADIDGAKETDE